MKKKIVISLVVIGVMMPILVMFLSKECGSFKGYFGLYDNPNQRVICHISETTGVIVPVDSLIDSEVFVDQGFGDFQNNIIVNLLPGKTIELLNETDTAFGNKITTTSQSEVNNYFEISFYRDTFDREINFSNNLLFSRVGELNGDKQYSYGFLGLPGFSYGIIIFDAENDLIFYAIGA